MDSFIASLKPEIIYLDALDNSVSAVNIPLYYWFETTVPSNVLEESFYRAMEAFPILAGRIKTGNDSRAYVEIDRDQLNMPVYTDSSCYVHFQALKDADFDIDLLPVDYSSARKLSVPPGLFGGFIKLAEFHVLRMADDSGMCVFASVSHGLFDATALCTFMNHWANISKCIVEAGDKHDICDIVTPTKDFQYDRSVLETDEHHDTDALDPKLCEAVGKGSSIARWLAWISPELRGRIIKYVTPLLDTHTRYAHLSSSALDRLLQQIRPFAEPGISHLSANDAISALVNILFAQALHKAGRLDGETRFHAFIAADWRPRIKRLANTNYVGNAVPPNEASSLLAPMLKECNPQVLAAVACNIRRTVDKMDERYCNQLWHLINKSPSSYINFTMLLASRKNANLSTNFSRMGFYETDFGSGSPVLVRPAFLASQNLVIIMPARPGVGGYDIAFFMDPTVVNRIKDSEYWQYFN
ncbi:hypothetical protein LPJ59_000229 [Coemansia sp. RSA 2399]|nr:hypothetical protein LPJ59_000229 [Coemansia sp. RSA 2399]KAJ1908284.1 hypothetical protein LPJ81_000195 [Coemansia sp. IMI 209127]